MSKKLLDYAGLQNFLNRIKSLIPTKTSELQNDSGFITSEGAYDSELSLESEKAVQNKVVTAAINTKQNSLSSGQLDAANSGITAAKVQDYDSHLSDTDIHVTQTDKTNWNSKAAGTHTHTASEVSGLSTVATSGSYNDLSNKPSIPSKTSDLTNDSGFLTSHNPVDSALSSTSTNAVQNKVINTELGKKANSADLAAVATSGSYNDLLNKPTIPTVNNATLTIQKNGAAVNTFTANSSSNVTANITVPVNVSELTNDSGYLTSASSLDSSKLTGTIDIARLPKGALERLVTVADQTARFALTVSDVQLGDTVKQLDTGVMYIVSDESKLSSADGYTEYTAGSATSVPWSGVQNKPSAFTPASHTHGSITNDGKLGTASRALVTDSSKKIAVSSVTSTELGYLSGVTSAVQTQLNGKSDTGHTHTSSEVSGLATVATSGSYNDLSNKPSIPSKTSDLTNDSGFLTSHNPVDSALSSTSTNAVQNKVVKAELDNKSDTGHTHTKSEITDFPTLSTVATSGSYNDLSNKPTIPTVYNKTLTIQQNGTTVKTFTANSNADVTANIVVPTKTSDLTNDSGYLTAHQSLADYSTKADTIKNLSISGKVITYTKGDDTTGTLTTQDTVYTHPTSAGNKHIPSGGSANQYLKYSASGTAQWATIKTSELNNDSGFLTSHNPVDSALSTTSENAVQNKVVKAELDNKANSADLSTVATTGSYTDLNNIPSNFTPASHTHGSITNDGKLGTAANKPLITGANGVISTGSFGTSANTFCQGNDSRLSDARTPLSHSHGNSDITSLDASKLTGTIDIARLPEGALERLVTVQDQTARFALTSSDVQLGDTVKQLDTGVMYIVTDVSKLNSADGYTEYTAGTATSVPWSGVTGKPSSFTPSSHTHGSITNDGKLGTASKVLITDSNKKITTSSVSDTELGYLSGVTSSVQTQLNAKANDSSVVHTIGNETIGGNKSFTEMMILNSASDVAEQFRQKLPHDPSVYSNAQARFNTLVDSEGHNVAVEAMGHWDTYVSRSITLKYKNDKQGVIDFRVASNGTGLLYPQSPFECTLGNSSNRWKSVYSDSYYLGSTAFGDIVTHNASEFLTSHQSLNNYVTLDGTQTITGTKKFKSANSNVILQSTTAEIGSTTASSNWISWQDKNADQTGFISRDFWNDGSESLRLSITGKRANNAPSTSGTATDCGLQFNISTDGSKSIIPISAETTDLGSSTNKWKKIHTNVVNTSYLQAPGTSNSLVIRAMDTWEDGARIFMYGKDYSNGCEIYTDIDHNDGSHTKTALSLKPSVFLPAGGGTSGVSLGNSTNRWSNVYANNYYLGTTAFTDKFVTTDTSQQIYSYKAFSNSLSVRTPRNPDIQQNPTEIVVGKALIFDDNTHFWAQYIPVWETDGSFRLELGISNYKSSDGSQGYWTVRNEISKDFGTFNFYTSHQNANLGTESNKWARAYINKVYGTLGTSGSSFAYTSAYALYFFAGSAPVANCFEGSSSDFTKFSYPAGATVSSETATNIQTLRLTWGDTYWHDIFASPNGRYLWHRDVIAGTPRAWTRLIEEDSSVIWGINISGNAGTSFQVRKDPTAGNTADLVYSNMATNDFFRIQTGGSANAGYAEIATADDGNEPIYVRQYAGEFTTVVRTATLLDGSGNTYFPGTIYSNNQPVLTSHQSLANYVTLNTDQTITGLKKFRTITIDSTQSIDVSQNPSERTDGNGIGFWDAGGRYWFDLHPVWKTDGSFAMQLGISNYTTSGSQGWWAATCWDISKDFGTLNVYSSHENAGLGTSTYPWNAVLSKHFRLISSEQELGVTTTNSTVSYIEFSDKNNTQLAYIGNWRHNSEHTSLTFSLSEKYSNGARNANGTLCNSYFSVNLNPYGVPYLHYNAYFAENISPLDNNNKDLGDSQHKWRNIYISGLIYRNGQADNGSKTELNNCISNVETYGWASTTSNKPSSGYGTLLVLNREGNVHTSNSDGWISQIGVGTDNRLFSRTKTNTSGAWSNWVEYVTTNTVQAISGHKVFENGLSCRQNLITSTTAPANDTGISGLDFWCNNNKFWGAVSYAWRANGDTQMLFALSNWNGDTQGYYELQYGVDKAFSQVYFKPNGANYCNLGTTSEYWKSTFSGEFHAYNQNAFMSKSGNYTFLIRNDGSNTYFLMSESGGNEGTWSSARPLIISNSTGICDINGTSAKAKGLDSSASITQNGVTYTGGTIAIGSSAGQLYKGSSNNASLISAPENGTYWSSTAGNVQNLRMSWATDGKYLHDIFVSPNNDYIWHRNVSNGTARGWRRVVEENVSGLTDQTWSINIGGTSANVTGTVAIANGGTGATSRLNAVKNLTNENVGTGTQYFLTITSNWGKAGYCSVADAKTVLGLGSAAYTASTAYAAASHTHSQYLTAHQDLSLYPYKLAAKTSSDQHWPFRDLGDTTTYPNGFNDLMDTGKYDVRAVIGTTPNAPSITTAPYIQGILEVEWLRTTENTSSYKRIIQKFHRVGPTSAYDIFIRRAYLNSSSVWVWADWEQVVTIEDIPKIVFAYASRSAITDAGNGSYKRVSANSLYYCYFVNGSFTVTSTKVGSSGTYELQSGGVSQTPGTDKICGLWIKIA